MIFVAFGYSQKFSGGIVVSPGLSWMKADIAENVVKDGTTLSLDYGDFFDLVNNQILMIGGPESKSYPKHILGFTENKTSREAYEKCSKEFQDFSHVEENITNAFKHYKYYYPEKSIPNIYTMISGFNYSIVTSENILGIGLEMYLGKNSKFYEYLQWPKYKRYKMHTDMIPIDCMKAWGEMNFPYNDSVDNLLSRIIYNGKIAYFTKAMLPDYDDSLLMAYTPNQLKWMQENENQVWAFLIEKKMIFSSNHKDYQLFIEDAPFTTPFSNNSAPRTGVWIGRQIVMEYMKRNKNCSLQELMANDNYQKILTFSSYNP